MFLRCLWIKPTGSPPSFNSLLSCFYNLGIALSAFLFSSSSFCLLLPIISSIVFLYNSDDTVVSVVVAARLATGVASWTGIAGKLKALRDGVTKGESDAGAGVGAEARD